MTVPRLGTIAVIAKAPVAGKVKTRLIGDGVDAAEAAALAECALRDTFTGLAGLRVRRRVVVLEGRPGPWLPRGWSVRSQSPGGLDERLCSAFDDMDVGPAMLIGMDTPQIRPHHLLFASDRYDACLGLAEDGGYWGIGFSVPSRARSVISGVPMSVAHTAREQLDRMRGAGMRVQLLDTLIDVDDEVTAAQVARLNPSTQFAARWRQVRPTSLSASP